MKCEEITECDTVTFDIETSPSPTRQRIKTESKPNGVKTSNHLSIEKKREIFDAIYDDIYEVVLPNPLWGIHRDPEDRQYIAFTTFNANKMNGCYSIAVYIADTFDLKVFANGVQKTTKTLPELSVEIISKLVNQINEEETGQSCPESKQ